MQGRNLWPIVLALLVGAQLALAQAPPQTDPLPSWNEGPAKQAIVDFVKATTDQASPKFVAPRRAWPPSTRTARCGCPTRCIPR